MKALLVTQAEAQRLIGPGRATRVMVTGVDDLRLMNKWIQEQGMPTLNRRSRRATARTVARARRRSS